MRAEASQVDGVARRLDGYASKSGNSVGTRNRVVAWLASHGDVDDMSGRASAAIAQHVSYLGSSVAFAQLLSGMERSGLITREVRGKRTYRIALTSAGLQRAQRDKDTDGASTAAVPSVRTTSRSAGRAGTGREEPARELDYDELARRLLEQVAYRLTDNAAPGSRLGGGGLGDLAADHGAALERLERRISALETELARARTTSLALQGENEELRAQLGRVRTNLAGSTQQEHPSHTADVDPVDHRDIALLQSLLAERGKRDGGTGKADTSH